MKHLSIWMLLTFFCVAQTKGQKLKIGDKIPDLTFKKVINHNVDSLKLEDYRGKPLIMDFWNTRCIPCFKLFPKLDSLQNFFKDKIQIILVNNESKENTELFFKKHSKIFKPNLPMATEGQGLFDLFPIDGYPYSTWIDGTGIIKYYSGAHSITEKNINDFLMGKDLQVRNPTLIKYGSSVDRSKFEYFSSIAHCSDSINIGNTAAIKIKNGNAISISCNCNSIADLYLKAYNSNGKFNFKKEYNYILEVQDKNQYEYPADNDSLDKWLNQNAYSYQLVIPIEKAEFAYAIMQEDLARYFDLEAVIVKRKLNSLVLKKNNGTNNNIDLKEKSTDSLIYYKDISYDQFVRELTVRIEKYFPFFVELENVGNISCALRYSSLSPLNIASLREDLNRSGFNLVKEKREIPVLILRKKVKKEQLTF